MIDLLTILIVIVPQLVVLWLKYRLQTHKNIKEAVISVAYSSFISFIIIFSMQTDIYAENVSIAKYRIRNFLTATPRSLVLAFISLLFKFSYIPKSFKQNCCSKGVIVSFFLILFGVALRQFSFIAKKSWGEVEIDQLVFNVIYQMPGLETKRFMREYLTDYLLPKLHIIIGLCAILVLLFPCLVEFDNTLSCFTSVGSVKLEFKIHYAGIIISIGYIYKALTILQLLKIDNLESTDLFSKYYVNPSSVLIDYPEVKQNIIILQLESMEMTYASAQNGGLYNESYIPELEAIACDPNNVHFSDTDKLGGVGYCVLAHWTNGAIVGYNSGLPLKLGKIPGKVFLPNVVTFTDILKNAGYDLYFATSSPYYMYGATYIFTTHGNATIYDHGWISNYLHTDPNDKGPFEAFQDVRLYNFTYQILPEIAAKGQPFLYIMQTLDTHFPCGFKCPLCRDEDMRTGMQIEKVARCASRQLNDLVQWLKKQEFYKNSTIFITGDHFFMAELPEHKVVPYSDRKIYNTFLNPVINCSNELKHNRKLTTYDWFPTMLASIGFKIEGERLGFGTNLFSGRKTYMEEGVDFNGNVIKYSKFYLDNILGKDGAPSFRLLGRWTNNETLD